MTTTQFETGWRYDEDNGTWRPPSLGTIGPHEHVLGDIRPGTLGAGQFVPAANVLAGTFGVGSYTFPGQLTIVGNLNTNWIELRNTTGEAAIDFTRTPGTADFNVRLTNDASGYLTLYSYAASGVRSSIRGDVWQVSQYVNDNSYAHFGHKDKMDQSSTTYAFLHKSDGEIHVNTNTNGHLRYNGNIRLQWGNTDVFINVPLNMGGNKIWTKVFGDDLHRIQHSGGLDWLEIWSYGGTRFINGPSILRATIGGNQWFDGFIGGPWGGNGGGLRDRGGDNVISFDWDGTFRMIVDSTNVKNFVIDHPLKQDSYLIHACLEGPEAGVYYRGQGQLENGWTEIKLPDYFESLCAEEGRSVQLTCIADDPEDEWCPALHATYPKNGRFFVGLGSGTNMLDQKFWWEVKAIRKDVAPIKVEPTKKSVVVMGDGPYTYYKEK